MKRFLAYLMLFIAVVFLIMAFLSSIPSADKWGEAWIGEFFTKTLNFAGATKGWTTAIMFIFAGVFITLGAMIDPKTVQKCFTAIGKAMSNVTEAIWSAAKQATKAITSDMMPLLIVGGVALIVLMKD